MGHTFRSAVDHRFRAGRVPAVSLGAVEGVGTGRGTCRPPMIAASRGACSSGIAGAVEGVGTAGGTTRGHGASPSVVSVLAGCLHRRPSSFGDGISSINRRASDPSARVRHKPYKSRPDIVE
jgi:hypothetical protein